MWWKNAITGTQRSLLGHSNYKHTNRRPLYHSNTNSQEWKSVQRAGHSESIRLCLVNGTCDGTTADAEQDIWQETQRGVIIVETVK